MEKFVGTGYLPGLNSPVILPSALFAPISYFALLLKCQSKQISVTIEENDRFFKQTIRNRYRITTAQGALLLSVPLVSKSSKSFMSEIKIDYDTPWQKEQFRTLQSSYSSTPFFEHYIDALKPIFIQQFNSLVALNRWSLSTLINLLDLEIKPIYSPKYIEDSSCEDFRQIRTEQFMDIKKEYYQLNFDCGQPFVRNLSILDLLFNHGPESRLWLHKAIL